jgi:hypothetical protein
MQAFVPEKTPLWHRLHHHHLLIKLRARQQDLTISCAHYSTV